MAYDVKLKDGRYFTNIIFCDEFGLVEGIEYLLENQLTNDKGQVEKFEMTIFKDEDEDCLNELAKIYSDDIEYIAEAYKYKSR